MVVEESAIVSENWGVTQFQELNLKYTWMIDNFRLTALKEENSTIFSPDFWPPGNENFKWSIGLGLQSKDDPSYMSLYLYHRYSDNITVSFTVTLGSKSKPKSFTQTFDGKMGYGWPAFSTRNEIFDSCLSNKTLIINCEISTISNVIEASGTFSNQCISINNQKPKKKLSDDLMKLLENDEFSDVTIIIEDNEIQAHKVVLAARSTVFASLLRSDSSEGNNTNSSTIEINDVKLNVFKELLRYIYTDNINSIDSTMAKELLVAAIKYDLEELKSTCEAILCNGMNVDNAIEILKTADEYDLPRLKSQAAKFSVERGPTIIKSTGFKNLERSIPNPIMYDLFRMSAYKSIADHA